MGRLARAVTPITVVAIIAGSGCGPSDAEVRARDISDGQETCTRVAGGDLDQDRFSVGYLDFGCRAVGSTLVVSFSVDGDIVGDRDRRGGPNCKFDRTDSSPDRPEVLCDKGTIITDSHSFDAAEVVGLAEQAAALAD